MRTLPILLRTLVLDVPAVARAAAQAAVLLPEACPSPDAAVNARFVQIGGIEQWVTITGERCGNPVLLFLHGGPGNPLSPYAAAVFSGWETDFTLVQWDQRGA